MRRRGKKVRCSGEGESSGEGRRKNGSKRENKTEIIQIGLRDIIECRTTAEGVQNGAQRGARGAPAGKSNKTKDTGRKYKHLAQLVRQQELQTIHGRQECT